MVLRRIVFQLLFFVAVLTTGKVFKLLWFLSVHLVKQSITGEQQKLYPGAITNISFDET